MFTTELELTPGKSIQDLESVTTLLGVVTGTHCAGKTTLLRDYAEASRLFDVPEGLYEPSFLVAAEKIGARIVPVVIAPEAATAYAPFVDRPVLTSGYTLEDQIGIELRALTNINTAASIAAELAKRLHRERPLAVVLSDRSELDGHVYSRLRAPQAEQEVIDLRAVAKATGTLLTAPTQTPILLRAIQRATMAKSCDAAFVVDETEVAFEDNGLREEDLAFRSAVADRLRSYYKEVLSPSRVHAIQGNRAQRTSMLRQHIRHLLIRKL